MMAAEKQTRNQNQAAFQEVLKITEEREMKATQNRTVTNSR